MSSYDQYSHSVQIVAKRLSLTKKPTGSRMVAQFDSLSQKDQARRATRSADKKQD